MWLQERSQQKQETLKDNISMLTELVFHALVDAHLDQYIDRRCGTDSCNIPQYEGNIDQNHTFSQ
jgi:aspartate carbamoyltransferase catalytic subunit